GTAGPPPGPPGRRATWRAPWCPDRARPPPRRRPELEPGDRASASTGDQRYDHAPDDAEDDDRQDRADVDAHSAGTDRRDHAAEDIEVRIDHLVDEVDSRSQPRVVGHPGD